MKLEVGKKYKDRRGNMVEITAFRDQLTKYPFVGCNHETYTKSGTWDKHGESDKDLIEELNMLHLEVGKKYKTKAGIVVEIIKIDAQYGDFRFIGKEEGLDHEGRYRSEGRYSSCGEHAYYTSSRLIEEMEMVIKLEVGKKYRNLKGDLVIIQSKSVIPCARPFKGLVLHTNAEMWYMENGHHIADYTVSINDLVEEMDEDIKDKSFKSVQEIYAYLGNGGIVKVKNNAIIYYFENDELTREYIKDGRKDTQREKETRSEIMSINFDIDNFEKYERPVTKNWYDDIPEQGILCMVRHKFETVNEVTLIFRKTDNLYRDMNGNCWSNARPATLEDLKQYLYESA